ncbi:MAG: alpha/beta fold hydrolase [Rhizobiaceae bacterium]|nr:alpha/beta fold hydrolase [Rhizobiaceae bacterium]
MSKTLTLPRLGETMEEARVTAWIVAEGAAFKRGDVLLEVETDKTVVEVPALQDGVLLRRLVAEGETVRLGAAIAEVEGAETTATATGKDVVPDADITAPEAAQAAQAAARPASSSSALVTDRVAASPAARAYGRTAGVPLSLVEGTGRRGRVTQADMLAHSGEARRATIILIHGLYDSPAGWRDIPRKLASDGFIVRTPALPGHGGDRIDEGAPLAALIDAFVSAQRDPLPEGPVIIAGHSIGALFAAHLALALGPRVRQVILSAPAGLGARINADFLDGMAAAETTSALGRALNLLDAGPLSEAALAAELSRLRAARCGMAALARLCAHGGMQQIDLSGPLARLSVPVTALFGVNDRIVDWCDCVNLPESTAIHVLKSAGHLPHLAADGLFRALLAGQAPRRAALQAG